MKPVRLCIKGYYLPQGIDTETPVFAWQLESDRRGRRQAAYRILVSDDDQMLAAGIGNWWDSGKVISEEQLGVPYAGRALRSFTAYHWKVAVWNEEGEMAWSDPQTLFTGPLRPSQWQAKWVGSGSCRPLYLRHEFEIDKPVKRAYALVSGLGQFKLFMNGRKVGNHELDPGWTNYNRSVQYVGFDVKDDLRPGTNAIGLSIGNGFYAGDAGGRHFYTMDKGYHPYGDELKAFGEWHIEFADGSRQLVRTGAGDWKTRASATMLANVYGSENYDARQYPEGWNDAGFDDSEWERAKAVTPPRGVLVTQNQPPVIVKAVYDTIRVTEPKERVYVFDLGQNMSGQFEIHVSGPAGAKVTVKPGELMNEDGTVAMPWDIVTYSEYTLAGNRGIEVWKPDFSYCGARWVQIEGCTRDETDRSRPFIHDVKGHFVTSAAADVGSLVTDDPRIERLAGIIVRAIESNMQSVHTDCPTIEKLGWLETSHLMGPSIMYVKHAEELWLKIVRDMIEAQTEEGLIPDIAPEYSHFEGGFRDSIAWGSALLIVPDLLFATYGDRTAIEEAYPAMKAYMNYLRTKEVKGGLIGDGLGDWGVEPQSGGDYVENVETAFYYYDYRLMAKFAGMLGLSEEAARYTAEAERVKRVYNERFLRPVPGRAAYGRLNGGYDPDNQVVQAMPISLGLVPDVQRQKVEAALLRATSSGRLRSGEIGLRFLFGALAGMGRNDIVYDMMMQPEHPSYIRFVEQGETALPEFWTDEARSRNHDMLGHILEWLYKAVLGISSDGEAYKHIIIAPCVLDRVRLVRGHHDCARGRIAVDFAHSDREVVLNVTIPPNTTANVRIPVASEDAQMLEGCSPVDCRIVTEGGRRYGWVTVGSGRYRFISVTAR